MSKVRVPIANTPTKVVTIESDATIGATFGVDLRYPNGTLVQASDFGAPPSNGGGTQPVVTIWRLILEIPPNITALANTGTAGLYVVTGAGTSVTREIQGVIGRTTVSDCDGVAGDPVVDLAVVPDAGGGEIRKFDRDSWGRVTGTSAATTDDLPEGATNLYFSDERAQDAVVVQTITNGDTTHAPSGDAVFDALAGKEPAIAPGTTAQLWRGDKTWGNNILGNFGVGTATPGIIGNGRELSVSVDGAVNALARLNLQGNRNTTTGNIASFTAYNAAVPIAQLTAGCDGATDAGAFTITTKPTGGALTARMSFLSTGPVVPGADNVQTFGSASLRWSEIFAGNGVINTSDAREKTIRGPLTEAELAFAIELASLGTFYQWNAAIAAKGDAARWHFGPTVQAVIEAAIRHGLDPFRYGFICYDTWDEQPEVWHEWPDLFDEDGNLVREAGRELAQEYRPAGDRYSLRHTQLLLFIHAGAAQERAAMRERISRLEALIPPPAAQSAPPPDS